MISVHKKIKKVSFIKEEAENDINTFKYLIVKVHRVDENIQRYVTERKSILTNVVEIQ
jgi:hypothetical protein